MFVPGENQSIHCQTPNAPFKKQNINLRNIVALSTPVEARAAMASNSTALEEV
jgi:hypothetical protein